MNMEYILYKLLLYMYMYMYNVGINTYSAHNTLKCEVTLKYNYFNVYTIDKGMIKLLTQARRRRVIVVFLCVCVCVCVCVTA